MIIFKDLNEHLDIHAVATWAGLHENKSGFILCPFHSDRHPSMKLYSKSAFCFSCGAWCDSIGLVAQVKDLSQSESARLLREAFSLPVGDIPFHSAKKKEEKDVGRERISLWCKAIKGLLTIHVRDMAHKGIFCDWAEQILDDSFVLADCEFYSRYNCDRRINAWLMKKTS